MQQDRNGFSVIELVIVAVVVVTVIREIVLPSFF